MLSRAEQERNAPASILVTASLKFKLLKSENFVAPDPAGAASQLGRTGIANLGRVPVAGNIFTNC